MLRVIYSRQAQADLLDQYVYLGFENPAVAERFISAVRAAVTGLAEMPGKGAPFVHPNPRTNGVRRWVIAGFPKHLLIYRERNGALEILRILHGARDLERLLADEDLEFDF